MKNLLLLFMLLFSQNTVFAQKNNYALEFEPSVINPFGKPNPDAPKEITDFAPMIGICDCKSLSRNPDRTWADTVSMVWKFKYIMNGTAVQDEVWRANELYAGSIRQFHQDSAKWVVSYFSFPSVAYTPGVWHGSKIGDDIVLLQPQKAPNGMDGVSTLTFYEMSENGFNWKGEWMKDDKQFSYPFWKIYCKKRK